MVSGPTMLRLTFAATTAIIAFAALVLFAVLRGCMNEHYRPGSHADMTFDIAPTDDALVFNATGQGGRDLYILHLDDLRVTRVAETPEYEVTPSFSPDGGTIAYAAGLPGDRADHIFIRSIDGGPARQLTHADANDVGPRFSPDGSLLVFARDKTYNWGGLAANWDGGGVICVVGIDGRNERQLTPDEMFAFAPSFSIDGRSVYFSTMTGLFSVPVDGSEPPTMVTPSPGVNVVLSPDGTRLAFSDGRYSPDHEIFIANADGTARTRLTAIGGCFHPVFTHKSDRLFFLQEIWPNGPTGTSKWKLWAIDADGQNLEKIANPGLFDEPLR